MIFILSLSDTVYAGWFGPSNYSECILDKTKGLTHGVQIHAAQQLCKKDFCTKKKTIKKQVVPVTIEEAFHNYNMCKSGNEISCYLPQEATDGGYVDVEVMADETCPNTW